MRTQMGLTHTEVMDKLSARKSRKIDGLIGDVPQEARSVVLYKHDRRDVLIACESVEFLSGASGIDTVLRRAHISGQVKVGDNLELGDYFADILDANNDIITNVMLDRGSYRALKTRWMRTKIQKNI